MKLVRSNKIPSHKKRICDGPIAGGLFLALDKANDLPNIDTQADHVELLRGGILWLGKSQGNPDWKIVNDISDIDKFLVSHYDSDYNGNVCISVLPYMPQFYWKPKNVRGSRTAKRLQFG